MKKSMKSLNQYFLVVIAILVSYQLYSSQTGLQFQKEFDSIQPARNITYKDQNQGLGNILKKLNGIEHSMRKVFAMPTAIYHESLMNLLTSMQQGGGLKDRVSLAFVLSLLGTETERLMRLKDPCKFFSHDVHDKVFLWLRFSKIGGTTFSTYLMNFAASFGLQSTGCDYYSNNRNELNLTQDDKLVDFEACGSLEEMPHDKRANISLVYGHQAFGNHRIFPDRDPVYIVMSRDVADLVYSFYNYGKQKYNFNRSFTENMDQGTHPHPNELTRYTCGPSFGFHHHGNVCSKGDEVTLAVAKFNLARVDFIPGWFIDHFKLTQKLLVQTLWKGFGNMEAKTKFMPSDITYKSSPLTDVERKVVEGIHHLDIKLNRFIMDYFESVQECLV